MEKKNKEVLLLLLLQCLLAFPTFGQHPVFEVPKEGPVDSLFAEIFGAYEYTPEQVARTRRFGWARPTDRIDVDRFFNQTKQHCIDRVGEAYFYKHFRFHFHSFKDDTASHIYTINYRFYLPGMEGEYVDITFKSFDFLGFHEEEYPSNLPDCRTDAGPCTFPINKAKAQTIAQEQVVEGDTPKANIHKLTQDYIWKCAVQHPEKGRLHFDIDARTGEVRNVKQVWVCGTH